MTDSSAATAAPLEAVPPASRMAGWPLAILVTAVYSVGMAGVWIMTSAQYSDTANLVRQAIPYLAILVLLMVIVWRVVGQTVQGNRQWSWAALWFVVPVAVLVVGGAYGLATASSVSPGAVFAVLAGTLLVGIGEELAFRGLALSAIAGRHGLIVAVFGSSVLFGIMHGVNVLAGSPVQGVVVQVVLTSITGIAFGWTYVLTGRNLALVMVLHWLYDFALIAVLEPAASGASNPVASFIPLPVLIAAIALSVVGVRRVRRERREGVLNDVPGQRNVTPEPQPAA